MLTSRTRGARILSQKESDLREKILQTPESYTDEEIAEHDLEGLTRGRRYNDSAYQIETSPVDPRTSAKKIDMRKIKGRD